MRALVLLAGLLALAALFLLGGASAQASVSVTDYAFTPGKVQVTEGASVTWKFGSRDTHTVTPDGQRGTWCQASNAGDCAVAFPTAGTYSYHCALHPTMTGVVEVVQAPPAPTAPAPSPVTPPPNTLPVARFDAALDGLRVVADASSSSDAEGPLVSYAWVWGDFTLASSGVLAEHEYAKPGTYEVRLTVTDAQGGSSQVVRFLTVELPDRPPHASFSLTPLGLRVEADATASFDPEGAPLAFEWDWGDGSAGATGAEAVHEYAAPGPWNVTLRVSDPSGHSASASREILLGAHEEVPPAPEVLVPAGADGDAVPSAGPPPRVSFSDFGEPRIPGPAPLALVLVVAVAALLRRRG